MSTPLLEGIKAGVQSIGTLGPSVALGVLEDPLIRLPAERILGEERYEAIRSAFIEAGGDPKVGAVADIGLQIALGGGAMALGRAAVQRAFGSALARVAAGGLIERETATVGARILAATKRAVPRATEILGESAALATFEGAIRAAESEDVEEGLNAARSALFWGLGLTGGVTLGAKAISPAARAVPGLLERAFTRVGPRGQQLLAEARGLRLRLSETEQQLQRLADELARARAERKQLERELVGPLRGRYLALHKKLRNARPEDVGAIQAEIDRLRGQIQETLTQVRQSPAAVQVQALRKERARLGRSMGALRKKIQELEELGSKPAVERDVIGAFQSELERLLVQKNALGERLGSLTLERAMQIYAEGGKKAFKEQVLEPLFQLRQVERTIRTVQERIGDIRRLPPEALLREYPLHVGEVRAELRRLAAMTLSSPDTTLRQMGVAATVFVDRANRTFARLERDVVKARLFLDEHFRAARKAAGKRWRELLDQAADIYEQVGDYGAVRRQLILLHGEKVGSAIGDVFESTHRFMQGVFRLAADVRGIKPFDLSEMKVAGYIPHRLKNPEVLTKPEIQQRIIERIAEEHPDIPRTRIHDIVQRALRAQERGAVTATHLDFERQLPGTRRFKMTKFGLQYKSYDESITQSIMENLSRYHIEGTFGPKGTLVDVFVTAAAREGARVDIVRPIMEGIIQRNHYTTAQREIARKLVNTQIVSKLTFAALPNLTQSIATTAPAFGVGNTLVSTAKLLASKRYRREVTEAAGVFEELWQSWRRSVFEAEDMLTVGDLIADLSMRVTGFSATERWNRMITAATALRWLRRQNALLARGRLRGEALNRYRRLTATLGLDPRAVERRIATGQVVGDLDPWLTRDELFDAAKRAIQLTQFAPSATSIPILWRTPFGRVMTQFKTFAFQMTRFLTHQVLAEAARGNYKPIIVFLAVSPVASDPLREAAVKMRGGDRDHLDPAQRYLDNLMFIGGLGILQGMITAANFGGGLLEFVAGPTLSDLSRLAGAVLRLDPTEVERMVERQPAFQLGVMVMREAQEFYERARALLPEEEEPVELEGLPL